MDTIIQSQPMKSILNESTETDFNSTLLDDGTLFSSHTVKTISLTDLENNNNNINNNNHEVINDTANNTIIYESHRNRQPVKSTELTQSSDPLNTTLPLLPNINTPLPC